MCVTYLLWDSWTDLVQIWIIVDIMLTGDLSMVLWPYFKFQGHHGGQGQQEKCHFEMVRNLQIYIYIFLNYFKIFDSYFFQLFDLSFSEEKKWVTICSQRIDSNKWAFSDKCAFMDEEIFLTNRYLVTNASV